VAPSRDGTATRRSPGDQEEVLLLIVVVLPLKRGSRASAERLLANGPPFDPEAVGLENHEILVTDEEVVFVFEAPGQHVLDRLMTEGPAWFTAVPWKDLVAAPPRFAQKANTWRRSEPEEQLSSAPTPGPGDSDGGDIFAP
jgi:hypothetical protein